MDQFQQGPRQSAVGHAHELLDFLWIGDTLHALGQAAMTNDLGTFKELIADDMIQVLVGVNDLLGHPRPDITEHLDHLPSMIEVRLCVDDHAIANIDEPGVGVTDPVFFIEYREASITYLLHLHEKLLPIVCLVARIGGPYGAPSYFSLT